jgi:hypothetical protein
MKTPKAAQLKIRTMRLDRKNHFDKDELFFGATGCIFDLSFSLIKEMIRKNSIP